MNTRRIELLVSTASLAPREDGVLVIDETGDRKDGHKTAHVGRQYLANLGKIDNGVVSVTSLWADERVYFHWRLSHIHQPLGLRVVKAIQRFVPN